VFAHSGSSRVDVLGHVVELVGELALALGPGVREALVGLAPQQQSVRAHGLVELELVALVTARDLEAPSPVLEVLAPAWVFDHSIE
jgi:hypothetical protein